MEEVGVQRIVNIDGNSIVEDIEYGKETIYNGSIKHGGYTYQYYDNKLCNILADKNNGKPVNLDRVEKIWNRLKESLKGNNVEESHRVRRNNETEFYTIKPNGNIHIFSSLFLADYCDKKYPDKCIYLNGVLYFTPKYKVMIKSIPRDEVLRDTGIDTSIDGIFNPKQELLRVSYLLPYETEAMVEKLKAYLLSRQIKISDGRYVITGY